MHNKLKSLLGGAAVATLLIVPSLAAPQTPSQPPVPPKPPAAVHPVRPANYGDWVTKPQRSFNVRAVKFNDVVGSITVAVRDNGPMTLVVFGF